MAELTPEELEAAIAEMAEGLSDQLNLDDRLAGYLQDIQAKKEVASALEQEYLAARELADAAFATAAAAKVAAGGDSEADAAYAAAGAATIGLMQSSQAANDAVVIAQAAYDAVEDIPTELAESATYTKNETTTTTPDGEVITTDTITSALDNTEVSIMGTAVEASIDAAADIEALKTATTAESSAAYDKEDDKAEVEFEAKQAEEALAAATETPVVEEVAPVVEEVAPVEEVPAVEEAPVPVVEEVAPVEEVTPVVEPAPEPEPVTPAEEAYPEQGPGTIHSESQSLSTNEDGEGLLTVTSIDSLDQAEANMVRDEGTLIPLEEGDTWQLEGDDGDTRNFVETPMHGIVEITTSTTIVEPALEPVNLEPDPVDLDLKPADEEAAPVKEAPVVEEVATVEEAKKAALANAPEGTAEETEEYEVVGGDYLIKIAADNDTTVEALIELNPELEANPDLILIGQTITLSSDAPADTPDEAAVVEAAPAVETPAVETPVVEEAPPAAEPETDELASSPEEALANAPEGTDELASSPEEALANAPEGPTPAEAAPEAETPAAETPAAEAAGDQNAKAMQSFWTNQKAKYDPKAQFRFRVIIGDNGDADVGMALEDALGSKGSDNPSDDPYNDIPDDTNGSVWYAKSVDKPTIQIAEFAKGFHRLGFDVSSVTPLTEIPTFSSINMTLIDPSYPNATRKLLRWIRRSGYMDNTSTSTNNILQIDPSDALLSSIGTVQIQQLDVSGKVLEIWWLQDAFPTEINFGKLDYSSSDFVEISITWAYKSVKAEMRAHGAEETFIYFKDYLPPERPSAGKSNTCSSRWKAARVSESLAEWRNGLPTSDKCWLAD